MSKQPRALPAAVRRGQTLSIIERRGFVKVAELQSYFGISDVTARADLETLAESNSIRRVHGGAVSGLGPGSLERSFEVAETESAEQKRRIGLLAASIVESHHMIALDVGTTTTAIARALANRSDLHDVTVVTNSLNIALELESAIPRFTVIVTGGTLRPSQHSLVDPFGDAVLDRMRTDMAFVGCNGVDIEAGITNLNLQEADMKRRILGGTAHRVVVADSAKLGVVRNSIVASLNEIDLLVTGSEADDSYIQSFRKSGLKILSD